MSDLEEITAVVADTDAAQKALAFDPTILTDGIDLSDDELPTLPSEGLGYFSDTR